MKFLKLPVPPSVEPQHPGLIAIHPRHVCAFEIHHHDHKLKHVEKVKESERRTGFSVFVHLDERMSAVTGSPIHVLGEAHGSWDAACQYLEDLIDDAT